MILAEPARLDEYDKTEWRDIVFKVRPEITDDEFDAMWLVFAENKMKRNMQ